jgi:dTDP-L-rhamnose 4-epimerase
VAAIFSARLLAGRAPRVFEDGGQIRDLVHISDVVAATLAAMDASEAPGKAFNVATGQRIRIAELARKLCERLAPELEPEITLDDGLPQLLEWVAKQTVEERGDEALEGLRRAGLVG